MKLGRLKFKGSRANKPLTVSSKGAFLSAKDVAATPELGGGSLFTLDPAVQAKLAVKRYEMEPDFKLGVIGQGLWTKSEVIEQIKSRTEFGQLIVQVEMQYCMELMAALGGAPARTAKAPKVPVKPLPKVPNWKPVKKCIHFPVKTRALFCENTTDPVTTPFATYRSAHVAPVFAARGFNVIVLSGPDDTRANFVQEAKKAFTVYLTGIGHGSYTTYTGNMNQAILQVGSYDAAEVAGKGIHFLSCQTARTLGPDTVAKGARCYLGYDESFHLVWDNPGTPTDEFALFAKADSIIDITLANGGTAQQAYNAAIAEFNNGIAAVPGSAAASWLTYDRDHLKLCGDASTTIPPRRWVKICFPLKSLQQEEALLAAGSFAD